MSTATAHALKDLATAASLIASAVDVLASVPTGDLPAGHAAYYALLTEQIAKQEARAQIHAASAVRSTGAHKLDQPSFQAITDAGTNPSLEQVEAAAGHTITGRTHFKNARGLLHDWLDIPLGTASNRLIQTDCLLGGVDEAGNPTPAWLPELATEFTNPEVDPRLVVLAASKLHSARKDLGEGKAAAQKKAQLQAASIAFLKAEPKSARKHIGDLISQVKAGKRPIKALLESVGFFKKGLRNGLMEYLFRVLPSQAAVIDARIASWDNPATMAGNREGLKDLDAQFTGEAGSDWDDEESMPEWAKDSSSEGSEEPYLEDADPPESAPTDQDSPKSDPADEELPEETEDFEGFEEDSEPVPPKEPEKVGESAPWEDLRPERRRLVGFMALLMQDRNSGGPPGEVGFVAPQVSIILNWEKMQAQAQDFAVTASGIPLSPGEARAVLCSAGVYPVVLNGKSLPLDLGRTQRLYSKAQARAVRAAYRGCSYPGCSMPASRCEVDHLDAWEKGGSTDVRSADLNCVIHHTARHCGLFHAVKIPGGRPLVLLSPELDPEQKLRVNTFFLTPDEALAAEAMAEDATARWRAGELDVEIVQP